jgi:thymidylate synthase
VATVIDIESGRRGYGLVALTARDFGEERAPRGLKTRDLGHTVIRVATPFDALPVGVGRKLNTAIGAGEAVQLVAGRADHRLMPSIAPSFERYREHNGTFWGAYGNRIQGQVAQAVRKLKEDRDTRQAVVTLWNPNLDNVMHKSDYPCTVALNFAVEDDTLVMRTLMRSNDVWLGLPYDVFQFTQLQLTVARALGMVPGRYTHESWSLHLYEEHVDQVDALDPYPPVTGPRLPEGFGRDGDDWWTCQLRAREILNGHFDLVRDMTEGEEWYVEQLRPYVGTPGTAVVG